LFLLHHHHKKKMGECDSDEQPQIQTKGATKKLQLISLFFFNTTRKLIYTSRTFWTSRLLYALVWEASSSNELLIVVRSDMLMSFFCPFDDVTFNSYELKVFKRYSALMGLIIFLNGSKIFIKAQDDFFFILSIIEWLNDFFGKAYEYLDPDINDSKVEYSCKVKFLLFVDLSYDIRTFLWSFSWNNSHKTSR